MPQGDEREFYPYYFIFGYDRVPFKTSHDRKRANWILEQFCGAVENNKKKPDGGEEFANAVNAIDFEVLLARPPLGYYSKEAFLQDNFDEECELENNERNKELWEKWQLVYSFRDERKDLIDQSCSSKASNKRKTLSITFYLYCFTHLSVRAYVKKYPDVKYGRQMYQTFRFSKYIAALSLFIANQYISVWHL